MKSKQISRQEVRAAGSPVSMEEGQFTQKAEDGIARASFMELETAVGRTREVRWKDSLGEFAALAKLPGAGRLPPHLHCGTAGCAYNGGCTYNLQPPL